MVNNLKDIPGVGESIAKDLESLGYKSVHDLIGQNPEHMYGYLEEKVGTHVDRCVLYVFRCAVYYAETKDPDEAKLKWWNWSDSKISS